MLLLDMLVNKTCSIALMQTDMLVQMKQLLTYFYMIIIMLISKQYVNILCLYISEETFIISNQHSDLS